MILKRLNPKASVDNALKFTNVDALCCGDKGTARWRGLSRRNP